MTDLDYCSAAQSAVDCWQMLLGLSLSGKGQGWKRSSARMQMSRSSKKVATSASKECNSVPWCNLERLANSSAFDRNQECLLLGSESYRPDPYCEGRRNPSELSGGQPSEVELARCISHLISAEVVGCSKLNSAEEPILVLTGSSVVSIDTVGTPESERGGVGTVQVGNGSRGCSEKSACG